MAQSRSQGGTVLNVAAPGAEADCDFTGSSGDDGAEKISPTGQRYPAAHQLSAIASTLKSASLSDIEMRGFTFNQKRQTLHLQLRAAKLCRFRQTA
ncbi:hypothetical protein ACLK1T_17785 [Escherichia coli]